MRYANRRRVRITPAELARLIHLPDGVELVSIDAEPDPLGLSLMLVSDEFTEVPPDACAPYLYRMTTIEADGTMTVTWNDPDTEWSTTQEPKP